MNRIRVAGIVPMESGYALMHRVGVTRNKDRQEYYTFPGGGLEEGETLEQGVVREIKEEFGIDVKVTKKLYETIFEERNQKEYFYLCEYLGGEFGTGKGPEFTDDPKYKESGKYIPEIIKQEELENILLLPLEIKEKFLQDIKKGKVKGRAYR